jgi:O-antigen/teichoic acid export membrane protein
VSADHVPGAKSSGDLPSEATSDIVTELTPDEVRGRAAAGALLVGMRGIAIRVLGVVGNVVLARLLLPEAFGLIAFAASVTFVASFVADFGLGAGLIRRKEPPTPQELSSVAGFQLLATGAFALVVAVIALPLGRPGAVAAVMVASLPLIAFRTPGALLLERQLRYRPLVVVEFAETLAFNAFAITAVALGAGVWGVATAATFRTLVGALCMIAISPTGLVVPRFRVKLLRPLLAFGAQFQAVGFVLVARGLVFNAGVAAVGGLRLLGLWAIADRFLSVLALVLESLWRVSFPMVARLIEAGEDVSGLVARNVAVVTFAVGFLGCILVGAGPALVPTLLGEEYAAAAIVLPPACLSVALSVPVGAVVGGYLYAKGRPGAVLVPVIAHSLIWYAVTFPLLPLIGIAAVGVGSLAGGATGAVLLVRAADELDATALVRESWRPLLVCVLAGTAGLGGVAVAGDGVLGILAGGIGAAAVFLAGMAILDKVLLSRVRRLLSLAVREARGAPTRAAAAPV